MGVLLGEVRGPWVVRTKRSVSNKNRLLSRSVSLYSLAAEMTGTALLYYRIRALLSSDRLATHCDRYTMLYRKSVPGFRKAFTILGLLLVVAILFTVGHCLGCRRNVAIFPHRPFPRYCVVFDSS